MKRFKLSSRALQRRLPPDEIAPVIELAEARRKPSKWVLEVIRDVRKLARKGDVTSIGIAYVRPGGAVSTVYTATCALSLISAVSLLDHRVKMAADDD